MLVYSHVCGAYHCIVVLYACLYACLHVYIHVCAHASNMFVRISTGMLRYMSIHISIPLLVWLVYTNVACIRVPPSSPKHNCTYVQVSPPSKHILHTTHPSIYYTPPIQAYTTHHARLHTCLCTCPHMPTHAHTCPHMPTPIPTHMSTHMSTQNACTCVCQHISEHFYAHIRTYAQAHVYPYVHTHVYIHVGANLSAHVFIDILSCRSYIVLRCVASVCNMSTREARGRVDCPL